MGTCRIILSFPLSGIFLLLVIFSQFLIQAASSPLVPTRENNDASDQIFLDNININTNTPLALEPKSEFASVLNDPDNEESATTLPSWFTSTLLARRLLALSTTGVVSTVFPDPLPSTWPYSHTPPEVAGHSISMKEYIADCDEYLFSSTTNDRKEKEEERGNPIFLALRIATTFLNAATGSNNISLSIDWWDHLADTKPIYPGFPLSLAGLPRVTLLGYVEPFDAESISGETEKALQKCYLDAHPDAEVWLPGREGSPHSSFWARLVVTQIYWVGGFGDVERIGWINVSEWKGVSKERSSAGDGFGWGSVTLPGEE